MRRVERFAPIAVWLWALCGCSSDLNLAAMKLPPMGEPRNESHSVSAFSFRTQDLPFQYDRGETGSKWPVEVTGGGVGLLDFDGDGDLDLFFAQGGPLLPGKGAPTRDVLLRNDGNGRFSDVSDPAGLAPRGYGQGVTVADYDSDGDPDVYVTRYGKNTLWRNDAGIFRDVTAEAGVVCGQWSLGAAFFDYDGDGDLDLFVANYLTFDPAGAPYSRDPMTGVPEYGPPENFPGQPDVLYRNDGAGRFTDVTARAGIAGAGRGMGCTAADFDGDGRVDLLVANDAEANALWRNRGDGTFEDVAMPWGLAFNGQGAAEANMGIAHGDVDGDGLPDVAITHFLDEHTTLWRPRDTGHGQPFFEDTTFAAGLVPDSRPVTGWGITLADLDLDGWPDLVAANGHIRHEHGRTFTHENPPLLYRNLGQGRFRNVASAAGPYFSGLHQGRGLASGDLDGDGDIDLVVVHHHAPAALLWNETPNPGHWLKVRLHGSAGNRDAIGARVTVHAGGRVHVRTVDGGGGYLSSNDPALHFGLGAATRVYRVEVRWPSGKVTERPETQADKEIVVSEADELSSE